MVAYTSIFTSFEPILLMTTHGKDHLKTNEAISNKANCFFKFWARFKWSLL